VVADEVHRRRDVGAAGRLDDQRRRLLDQSVPEARRLVEAALAGSEKRTAQALAERLMACVVSVIVMLATLGARLRPRFGGTTQLRPVGGVGGSTHAERQTSSCSYA
jgi:hypothetical protein